MRNPAPVILLVLVSLLAAAASLPAQEGPHEPSPVAHQQFVFAYTILQRAQKTADKRDMKLAGEAFDDFLNRFPEEELVSDALYYRALIAHLQNDNRLAAWHLAKARKTVMVGDDTLRLLRGQVQAALGNHQAALDHLVEIQMQKLEDQVRATVWLLRADCHRQLSELHAAVSALEQAAHMKSPMQARALLHLGALRAQLGQRHEALEALHRCLALENPNIVPEAAWLAGDLYVKLHQYGKAIDHFQAVIGQYPTSPRFDQSVVDLMWARLKSGQHDQAILTFNQYRDQLDVEDRIMAYNLAASAYQHKGDHGTADAILQSILASSVGHAIEDQVLYKLVISQFELGHYDAMAVTFQGLRAAHPNSPYQADAQFLLARADVRQNKIDEAAASFTTIINAGREHPYYGQALHQRGWLYESRDQLAAAIGDYERVLAEALAAKPADAHEVTLRLVNLYSRTGQFKLAADRARRLLGVDLPQPIELDPLVEQEALYRWAWSLIKTKGTSEAHDALATLLKKHPLNRFRTEALYYDGLVLMVLDRTDEAVAALQEALKSDDLGLPERINALRLSALHLRDTHQDVKAAEALLELDKRASEIEAAQLREQETLWLGRYLEQQGRHERAIDYLKPLIGRNPNVPGRMRVEALYLIARSLRGLDKKDDAITRYRQVMAMANGFDLEAWMDLADTLKDAGRNEEAVEEYRGLINEQQTRVAARAMLHCAQVHRAVARQRALAQDIDGAAASNNQARSMLLRLTILHSKPEISPLPELARIELAEVETDLGRSDAAQKVFQELAEQFADMPYGLYSQAMLDLSADRRAKAQKLLQGLRDRQLDARLAKRVENQLEKLSIVP